MTEPLRTAITTGYAGGNPERPSPHDPLLHFSVAEGGVLDAFPMLKAMTQGGLDFAQGFTSADQILLLRGLGMLKSPLVQTANSTYFSADQIASAISSVPEVQRRIEERDYPGAARLATTSGLATVFGFLAGRAAVEGGAGLAREPGVITPKEGRRIVAQPLPEEIANANARRGLDFVDEMTGQAAPTPVSVIEQARRIARERAQQAAATATTENLLHRRSPRLSHAAQSSDLLTRQSSQRKRPTSPTSPRTWNLENCLGAHRVSG